jgi:leader peptidase (prepilin peptidase)/N-methyltransferase
LALGLVIGSFLNVVIERLPRGESVVGGRSRCPRCRHNLRWLDLIPLLSFVVLRGRCRYCGARISWRYPLVEVLTGVSAVSVVSVVSVENMTPLTLLTVLLLLTLAAILISIFFIDLEHGIIPNRLVYSGIVIALMIQFIKAGFSRPLFLTLLGSLVIFLFFYSLHAVFKGRAMGGGDVKLALLVGLLTGWPNMVVAIFLSFLTGALAGVILMAMSEKKFGDTIPFGPFLILAAFVTLFYGDQVLSWYLSLL